MTWSKEWYFLFELGTVTQRNVKYSPVGAEDELHCPVLRFGLLFKHKLLIYVTSSILVKSKFIWAVKAFLRIFNKMNIWRLKLFYSLKFKRVKDMPMCALKQLLCAVSFPHGGHKKLWGMKSTVFLNICLKFKRNQKDVDSYNPPPLRLSRLFVLLLCRGWFNKERRRGNLELPFDHLFVRLMHISHRQIFRCIWTHIEDTYIKIALIDITWWKPRGKYSLLDCHVTCFRFWGSSGMDRSHNVTLTLLPVPYENLSIIPEVQ